MALPDTSAVFFLLMTGSHRRPIDCCRILLTSGTSIVSFSSAWCKSKKSIPEWKHCNRQLVRKLIVHDLWVIIELVFASCYGKALRVGICRSWSFLKQWVKFSQYFRCIGRPSPATAVGVKKLERFLFPMLLLICWLTTSSFDHNVCVWQTDRRTDGQNPRGKTVRYVTAKTCNSSRCMPKWYGKIRGCPCVHPSVHMWSHIKNLLTRYHTNRLRKFHQIFNLCSMFHR